VSLEFQIGSLDSEKIMSGPKSENRVLKIREMGSLQIHTRYLTFSSKKTLIRLLPVCKCKYHLYTHGRSVTNVMEKSWNLFLKIVWEPCSSTNYAFVVFDLKLKFSLAHTNTATLLKLVHIL